jgi:hypothetical protein
MKMENQMAIISGIVALLATATIAATSYSLQTAKAEGKLPESGFGQASKDLATSSPGATGEHSQAGSSAVGSPPDFNNNVDQPNVPGREGIGNVAKNTGSGSVGQLGCNLDPNLNC